MFAGARETVEFAGRAVSIQDGAFAERAQIWRWRPGSRGLEPVREGLPEWLRGKVDTAHIGANHASAALVDGGGNLWCSRSGTVGWEQLARDLPWVSGVVVL
ncbi:MAG TPA: hypothetical protein VF384_07310 [Planctomycetota bacterium]